MSEPIQPAAQAVATTVVDPNAAAPVASPAAAPEASQPVTEQSDGAEKQEANAQPEQLRDAEGKFLPKHPRVEKLQSTINELTRIKHDTVREVERLKGEAAQLQRQLQTRPQLDPNDLVGQQTDAIQRAIKTEKLEDTVARAQALEEQSKQATQQIITAQVDALRENIQDIDRIFLPPQQGGPAISPMMAEAIARVENGALVAYHLMTNPHEAMRLCRADPWTVATEIGRISHGLKLPAPVKRVSQAPQPVQTVSGSPGNPAPDLGSLSYKDYERIRNEQELARAR